VLSELVIVFAGNEMTHLSREVALFKTPRNMNEARPFELVFLLEGPCFIEKEGRRVLGDARREPKEVFDSVIVGGFLDFLDSPPTICCARSHRYGRDAPFPYSD